MATVTVDISFLSSHYAIPEASIQALVHDPTVELVKQLLEATASKARETEALKSDKLRLEVELENAVRTSESKVKTLKNSVEKGLAEISNLRAKIQTSGNCLEFFGAYIGLPNEKSRNCAVQP